MLGTVQKLPLGWLVFEGGQRFCTKILRWRSFRWVADCAKIFKKIAVAKIERGRNLQKNPKILKNCGGENWEGQEFAKKNHKLLKKT